MTPPSNMQNQINKLGERVDEHDTTTELQKSNAVMSKAFEMISRDHERSEENRRGVSDAVVKLTEIVTRHDERMAADDRAKKYFRDRLSIVLTALGICVTISLAIIGWIIITHH